MKTLLPMLAVIIVFSIAVYIPSNELLLKWLLSRPVLFVPIIWIVYCIAEGKTHAYLYQYKSNEVGKDGIDEHPAFIAMRACVLLPLAAWLRDPFLLIGLMMAQPFFHNGMYYYSRKDVYGSWFDQSKRKKGLTSLLIPKVRIALLVIGTAFYTLAHFFYINTDF